jgi:hypothetical protein
VNKDGKVLKKLDINEEFKKINFAFSCGGISFYRNYLLIGSSDLGEKPGQLLFLDKDSLDFKKIVDLSKLNNELQNAGISGLACDEINNKIFITIRNSDKVYIFRIGEESNE